MPTTVEVAALGMAGGDYMTVLACSRGAHGVNVREQLLDAPPWVFVIEVDWAGRCPTSKELGHMSMRHIAPGRFYRSLQRLL